jgi:hypothetical protein
MRQRSAHVLRCVEALQRKPQRTPSRVGVGELEQQFHGFALLRRQLGGLNLLRGPVDQRLARQRRVIGRGQVRREVPAGDLARRPPQGLE